MEAGPGVKQFAKDEIERFLQSLDRELDVDVELTIIGGTAFAVQYGVDRTTTDIDTYESGATTAWLVPYVQKARAATGLEITLQDVGIADAPYGYRNRCLPLGVNLKRLTAWVPEIHDLAIMKIMRNEDKDLETLRQYHADTPFDLNRLLQLYRDETKHVIARPGEFDGKMEVALEELFGAAGVRAFSKVDRRRTKKSGR